VSPQRHLAGAGVIGSGGREASTAVLEWDRILILTITGRCKQGRLLKSVRAAPRFTLPDHSDQTPVLWSPRVSLREASGLVGVGDLLVGVNGVNVYGRDVGSVVGLMRASDSNDVKLRWVGWGSAGGSL
jgi:hypothetical protein